MTRNVASTVNMVEAVKGGSPIIAQAAKTIDAVMMGDIQ